MSRSAARDYRNFSGVPAEIVKTRASMLIESGAQRGVNNDGAPIGEGLDRMARVARNEGDRAGARCGLRRRWSLPARLRLLRKLLPADGSVREWTRRV